MNILVKKISICAILFFVVGLAAHAQKGVMAGGLNYTLAFNSDFYLPAGIAPKFQYYVTDHFRGEADVTFFLPKDKTAWQDLAVYAHYLFQLTEKAVVYPIAGVGLLLSSPTDRSNLLSWPNAAFGGGIEYAVSPKVSINAELKYKLTSSAGANDFGWLTIGAAYKFKLDD